MNMTSHDESASNGQRLCFLDNLRTFLIFLVVLFHCGLVYESSGIAASFWIVDDPATNIISGIFNLFIDIFVMSTLFFISGYLTPQSIKGKSGAAYAITKFKRLIIPWLLAVFTLIPLYKVVFLYSRNLPQDTWANYFHFTNEIFSQNWLWFLPVLYVFHLLYLLLTKIKISTARVSIYTAVITFFLLSFIYGLAMRVFELRGWTKSIVLDFQNERIFIYFLFYLLGVLCFNLKVFDRKNRSKKFYYIVNFTSWIPVSVYFIFLFNMLLNPDNYIFSKFGDAISITLAWNVSLFCMVYVLVMTFRHYFNWQRKITLEMSIYSYGVYIIHVIIMGGIALTLLDLNLSSLSKYLLLTASTYMLCNVLVFVYRAAKQRMSLKANSI
ncbi:MAG: acyltransferase family protein [bacterium]|nr:acyltransferase family protein [bacterium]